MAVKVEEALMSGLLADQWRRLSEASEDLATEPNRRVVAPKLLAHACRLVEAQKGVVVVKERGGWGYRLYRWVEGEMVTKGELLLEVKGLLAEVLASSQPREGRRGEIRDDGQDILAATRQFLSLPLKVNGFLLGVLALADRADGSAFSLAERELLAILATQGAMALENAWLYEQADERLQEKVAELHAVNLGLRGQQSLLQRSADLYQQLTELVLSGQGLEAICQSLYQVIQTPLVVEDEHFQVLVRVGVGEDQRHISVCDLPAGGANHRPVHVCRKATRVVLSNNGRRGVQVVVSLVAGQQVLGYLYALEADRSLGALEQMALENASTVLSLELLKARVAWETELRLRADFLEKVLSGAYAEESVLEAQARRLGLSLRQPYHVLLVRVEQNGSAAAHTAGLEHVFHVVKDLLPQYRPGSFLTNDGRHVVVIAPTDTTAAREQLDHLVTGLLSRLEEDTKAWCGLSSAGSGPGDLRRVYGEAVATIDIMQAIGRKSRAMCYTELGIFGMLSIDKNRFVDFTHKVLGPIMEYDRQHQLRLLETLHLYYNNNCNLQQTARASYVSLSTLKYRLRRIREISNLNLDDPDTRLQVQLALKLLL